MSQSNALRLLTAALFGFALATATVATQAASVTLTSELQFSAFNFNNGGGSGPYDAIDIALAVSFDSTLAATRKAVDSIKFGHDEFATTDVYFDYRPSVEVTPGNFNFQLDVYRDLPSGVDGDGLGVIFGSDDFLLRFAGLPFQLQDRIDAGGGGGLPELLPARQMLYTTSLPGFGSGYFVDGADQSSSALAVAPVPLPAAGWLCAGGLALLARRRR